MVFMLLHIAVWKPIEDHHGLYSCENIKMYVQEYAGVTDHCMALREKAGGDANLFKVEKRLRRLQKKHQQQSERESEREKQQMNVFDFINSKLGGKRGLWHVNSFCCLHCVLV
jgi:hypothetical protein